MTLAEKTKAISKAYHILRDINYITDLKKHNFTLSDYNAAIDIFKNLSTPGTSAKTFIKSVADFYKKAGFMVSCGPVDYTISTKQIDWQ